MTNNTKPKRAKKAIVKKRKVTEYVRSVECPHCKTILQGGIGEHTLRFKCFQCFNPIDLVHKQGK